MLPYVLPLQGTEGGRGRRLGCYDSTARRLDRFSDCGLLEGVSKLQQCLAQLETLLSNLEPYLKGVRVWSNLREVEGTLSALLQVVLEQSAKGPLVQHLQADRTLARFQGAVARLGASLAGLQAEVFGGPCSSGCAHGGRGSVARATSSDGRATTSVTGFRPMQAAASGNGESSAAAAKVSGGGGALTPAEMREELCRVRGLLQSIRFELPAAQQTNLHQFRQACDSLQTHFSTMLESYGTILDATGQHSRQLSKESFHATIEELQREVELQQQHMLLAATQAQARARSSSGGGSGGGGGHQPGTAALHHGQPLQRHQQQPQQHHQRVEQRLKEVAQRCEAEQHCLRMLMDVVRAHHINTDCEGPLEFICPLTHRLMEDPVLLHETGHSYERKALEEWWAKGHRFCPRTGVRLRRLNISPNHNLRSSIERWHLHCDMHLSFRPALNTLVEQQKQQQQQQKQPDAQHEQEQLLQGQVGATAHVRLADPLQCLVAGTLPPLSAEQESSCSDQGSSTSSATSQDGILGAGSAPSSLASMQSGEVARFSLERACGGDNSLQLRLPAGPRADLGALELLEAPTSDAASREQIDPGENSRSSSKPVQPIAAPSASLGYGRAGSNASAPGEDGAGAADGCNPEGAPACSSSSPDLLSMYSLLLPHDGKEVVVDTTGMGCAGLSAPSSLVAAGAAGVEQAACVV